MRPLTRREFFRALVPAWLTRRILVAALVIGCAVFLTLELADVLRTQGFVASARVAGFLVGAGLVVFLLNKLTFAIRQAIAAASDDFRSFATNLSRIVTVVIAMSAGALLHSQWSSGVDITPTLAVLALMFFMGLFRDEKKG